MSQYRLQKSDQINYITKEIDYKKISFFIMEKV